MICVLVCGQQYQHVYNMSAKSYNNYVLLGNRHTKPNGHNSVVIPIATSHEQEVGMLQEKDWQINSYYLFNSVAHNPSIYRLGYFTPASFSLIKRLIQGEKNM